MKKTNEDTNSKHTKANDREGLEQTPSDSSSEASKTKIVTDTAKQLGQMPQDGDPLPRVLATFMVELYLDLEAIHTQKNAAHAEFDRITQEDKFADNMIEVNELLEMTRLLARLQFELQRLGLKTQTIAGRFRDELLDAGVDVKELDAWRLG